MKTDDFISMLSAAVPPVDSAASSRRFGMAWLVGMAGATLLMVTSLGLRPDLGEAVQSGMFWLRLGFATAMAAASLQMVMRLARPGMPIAAAWGGLAVPVALAWLLAVVLLLRAPEGARLAMWLGHTWRVCPVCIAALAVPGLVANLWAVHRMAPVRLRLAGAAAGLLAGATATMAYCLHCPEMAPPFWAFWYLLGMAVPAAFGALLAPRVLRW